MISIRDARHDELESLRQIEIAAGQVFVEVGLPEIAAHDPFDIPTMAKYVDAGHAWVVANDDTAVGYAIVDIVDGLVHLEQVSVLPDWGRRGLGAQLLEHVCAWASDDGFAAVTLTTFGHLAWNAPFYAAHGFRELTAAELGPELRHLREEEARAGLDPALRVCMRREL